MLKITVLGQSGSNMTQLQGRSFPDCLGAQSHTAGEEHTEALSSDKR